MEKLTGGTIRSEAHRTAIHEAGHVVAALSVGCTSAYCYITPDLDQDRTFKGEAFYLVPPSMDETSALPQISAAGELACLVYQIPDLTVDDLMERRAFGVLTFEGSDSDYIPEDEQELRIVFEQVLAVLGRQRRTLCAVAEYLTLNYAAGVDVVAELWRLYQVRESVELIGQRL